MSKRDPKPPQTCQNPDGHCIGYLNTVFIKGEEYRRCPTCRWMYKVMKRVVKPIGDR